MRLNLLKSIARSLLRTANRRLSQYRKSGLKNPDIEDILETISERPYFNKEKGRLMTGGLDRSDLEELRDVEKSLRSVETPRSYKKTVEKIYKEAGYSSETDTNLFYRAIKRFESAHGAYYKEWTNNILEAGKIESKGDTLARWFKDILDEQKGHEYTPEEVEDLENDGGFEDF